MMADREVGMGISHADYLVGSMAVNPWSAPATMTNHLHRRAFVALLASGGLLFTACSGDKGGSEEASVQVDEMPPAVAEQLDQAQAADQIVARGNCAEAATALNDVVSEANDAVTSPETFSLEGMKADIEMVRMAIPDELDEAFATFAGAYTAFEQAIAGVGGVDSLSDPANAEVLASAHETLQNAETTAATKQISDHFATQCVAIADGSETPGAGSQGR